MNPRIRNVQIKAVKDTAKMSESECVEMLERILTIYRWIVFPDEYNVSKSKKPKTKRAKQLREAAKMAVASNLRALAIRLQNEYEKEL